MKSEPFVRAREEEWERYEEIVRDLSKRKKRKHAQAIRKSSDEFPAAYRRLCRDLALARERDFDPLLVERLNRMALAGHRILHTERSSLFSSIGRFIVVDFPRAVRRDIRLVGWAHLFFWGPFWFMVFVGQAKPEWITAILGAQQQLSIEEMYSSDNVVMGVPPDESRFMMFGFYIFNNIGIGLRTFGLGILFGIGSIFTLLFNGVMIGAVVAHLVNAGLIHSFLPFGIGHGSLELTAICLAGASGMKFGGALIFPGRRSRKRALIEEGREAVTILYGAVLFLFGAAIIEAFWSPSPIPSTIKYVVGGAGWLLVAGYFCFSGRERA